MKTAWTEFFAPDASSDRGWLKAFTAAWSFSDAHKYTSDTTPVWDTDLNAWREQSTLGNYLDYGPCRPGQEGPQVHSVCYVTKASAYHSTVAEAKAWIEAQVKAARPALFQEAA